MKNRYFVLSGFETGKHLLLVRDEVISIYLSAWDAEKMTEENVFAFTYQPGSRFVFIYRDFPDMLNLSEMQEGGKPWLQATFSDPRVAQASLRELGGMSAADFVLMMNSMISAGTAKWPEFEAKLAETEDLTRFHGELYAAVRADLAESPVTNGQVAEA